jgi:hypothetical protein
VLVDNVQQSPYDGSYSVNGTTITFSSAPGSGTNNIYIVYRDHPITSIQPKGDLTLEANLNVDGTVYANATLARDGGSDATINGVTPTSDNLMGRNRIINGAMEIDQRNAGASVTPTVDGLYSLDRWQYSISQASKFSIQQNAGSVTPPTGYINYLGVTSLSAYSVISSDLFVIQQNIEGLNCSDLAWGTANAATVTLSFWVRSSLTGTFGGSLRNNDSSRSYPFSFTISSSNTWEQKTITVAGDTTGTWLTTNGTGIRVTFSLGMGSTKSGTAGAWTAGSYWSPTGATSVVGTNGATFYVTGVQLEAGSVATSFERRSYGQELALCQRYCQTLTSGQENHGFGFTNGSAFFFSFVSGPVTMRSTPTISWSGTLNVSNYNSNFATINGVNSVGWSTNSNTFKINYTLTTSPSAQVGGINPNGNRVVASSEL